MVKVFSESHGYPAWNGDYLSVDALYHPLRDQSYGYDAQFDDLYRDVFRDDEIQMYQQAL